MDSAEQIIAAWDRFFSERIKRRQDLKAGYIRHVERLSRCGLPPIFEFRHLSELVGVDIAQLAMIVSDPIPHYRTFSLPKRRGGVRRIDIPSPELLSIQRWIYEEILSKISINENSHGFSSGRSIITNAMPHLDEKYILKMDIKDFFPNLVQKRGISVFLRMGYPPNVSYYLSCLCFLRGSLPQGAPTSPYLSNIISKRMDVRLFGLAKTYKMNYTRYADDLTFSGAEIPLNFMNFVSNIVNSERIEINHSKTLLLSGNRRKIVTGISLSNGKMRLPRSSVRDIKQKVHFVTKYGYFSHSQHIGIWDPVLLDRLSGKLGFWLQIEPDNKTALKLSEDLKMYKLSLDTEMMSLNSIKMTAEDAGVKGN